MASWNGVPPPNEFIVLQLDTLVQGVKIIPQNVYVWFPQNSPELETFLGKYVRVSGNWIAAKKQSALPMDAHRQEPIQLIAPIKFEKTGDASNADFEETAKKVASSTTTAAAEKWPY